MKLTQKMLQTLREIRNIEPLERVKELDVSDNELGNKLIELYYHSDNSRTHELITVFMKSAGIIWLRKLVTHDTTPGGSTGWHICLADRIHWNACRY